MLRPEPPSARERVHSARRGISVRWIQSTIVYCVLVIDFDCVNIFPMCVRAFCVWQQQATKKFSIHGISDSFEDQFAWFHNDARSCQNQKKSNSILPSVTNGILPNMIVADRTACKARWVRKGSPIQRTRRFQTRKSDKKDKRIQKEKSDTTDSCINFEKQCAAHTLLTDYVNMSSNPTYVILDSGCARAMGSRFALDRLVRACQNHRYSHLIKFTKEASNNKFSFAIGESSHVKQKFVTHVKKSKASYCLDYYLSRHSRQRSRASVEQVRNLRSKYRAYTSRRISDSYGLWIAQIWLISCD